MEFGVWQKQSAYKAVITHQRYRHKQAGRCYLTASGWSKQEVYVKKVSKGKKAL